MHLQLYGRAAQTVYALWFISPRQFIEQHLAPLSQCDGHGLWTLWAFARSSEIE